MKKIFAIVALVMTLMISVSCGNRSAKQTEAEEAVELVGAAADSVVVDSTAVAPEVVAE